MGGQVVPWYNTDEWLQVYNYISSVRIGVCIDNTSKALKILSIWKARCPSLPSGIESTLGLLQVQFQDVLTDVPAQSHVLRLAYSAAIMRFVNHMLDVESAKGVSLYKAAKQLGLPDWVIDLRHDTAHNHTLPTLELLREAAAVSMDWLHSHYWEKHKEVIRDYIIDESTAKNDDVHNDRLSSLIQFYTSLSICSSQVKKLSDITDDDMRESLITETRDLLWDLIDLSNLKTVSINSLINMINIQCKKLLKNKDSGAVIAKVLVDENSLFLSQEMVQFLSLSEFKQDKLNLKYVTCFEVLLTFLHSNDLILDLILELIEITKDDKHERHTCKLAALWLKQILQALNKSSKFLERINNSLHDGKQKKKQEMKHLFKHYYPNEKYGLYLDLMKPVPRELTELSFVQPIISTYNPYLIYFVNDLLNLLQPQLPKMNLEKIYYLASLISKPKTETKPTKIYTIADLQNGSNQSKKLDEDSDSDIIEMTEEKSDQEEHIVINGVNSIWKLASSEYNWSQCPIGVLPWQEVQENMEVGTN